MFFLNTISHLKATLFYVLYNCFLFRSISWILLQPLRRFGLARRPYALLIGIEQYKENGVWGQLPGARGDIRLYKEILTKGLGIHPYDIIVMNDFEFSPLSTFYPTRHNMEREIRKLGSSLRVGDLGFFSYSGHAKQLKEHAPSEADGMDEAIVPVDGLNEGENLIKDNELNSWLVAPLPAGATLLAACDCCHSGTLLDLPYKYVIREDEELPIDIDDSHNTNKGGEGFVLCISACDDDQEAHEVRNQRTNEVFGGMTALLHRELVSASGSSPMTPPTAQKLFVNLRNFFEAKGNGTKVQITSSKKLLDARFGCNGLGNGHQ